MRIELVHTKHDDISVGFIINWGWSGFSFFIMLDCYKHTFGIVFGEKPWSDKIEL